MYLYIMQMVAKPGAVLG